MRHLAMIGRTAGLRQFIAEVLADNTAMLKVFEKSGCRVRTTLESGRVDDDMDLASSVLNRAH